MNAQRGGHLRHVNFSEVTKGEIFLEIVFELGLKEMSTRIIIQCSEFH